MNSYRICLRLAQTDNTLSFNPVSLFAKLPIHRPSRASHVEAEATEYPTGKTTNDWRFGPITIDWIDQEMSPMGSSGLSAQGKDAFSSSTQRRKSVEASLALCGVFSVLLDVKSSTATAQFVQTCSTQMGSTEVPEGTVHIFRDTSCSENRVISSAPASVEAAYDGSILAVLAVPSHITPSDFLTFVAPAAESVAHLRMIRQVLQRAIRFVDSKRIYAGTLLLIVL